MPQVDEDRENRPLAGKRILLAEDEARLRTIMAMMIEELGAEVIASADGKGAIDEYTKNPGEIDLVILDIRMAGLSGEGAFKRLLELDPTVKVVLSSGIWPEDDLVELLLANKGGFVEKPFNLEKLSLVLTTVLDGKPMVKKI